MSATYLAAGRKCINLVDIEINKEPAVLWKL